MVAEITLLRGKIESAAVRLSLIPNLQKDTWIRNGHASTAIEGNPLTLAQVRALEEGRELVASDQRSQREVLNYFAGLRYVVDLEKGRSVARLFLNFSQLRILSSFSTLDHSVKLQISDAKAASGV